MATPRYAVMTYEFTDNGDTQYARYMHMSSLRCLRHVFERDVATPNIDVIEAYAFAMMLRHMITLIYRCLFALYFAGLRYYIRYDITSMPRYYGLHHISMLTRRYCCRCQPRLLADIKRAHTIRR